MSHRIQVRHISGFAVGTSREFDADLIRLGRKADNDIAFDDPNMIVSGRHAELFVIEGALAVRDVGSTNGTFVNGKRIEGPVPLRPTDLVSLGEGGPTLAAALPAGGDAIPATIRIDRLVPAPPQLTVPAPARLDDEPVNPRAPVFAPPPSDGISGSTVREPTDKRRAAPPREPSQPQWKIETASSRPPAKSRAGAVLAIAAAMMVAIAGLAAIEVGAIPGVQPLLHLFDTASNVVPPPVEEPQEKKEKKSPEKEKTEEVKKVAVTAPVDEWQEAVRRVAPSVYRIHIKPGDEFLGMAFSFKPGLLACDGSTADAFGLRQPGQSVVARSVADPAVELAVRDIRVHPGRELFLKSRQLWRPLDPKTGRAVEVRNPFDAAIIELDPADHARQAPALELVSVDPASDAPLGYAVSTAAVEPAKWATAVKAQSLNTVGALADHTDTRLRAAQAGSPAAAPGSPVFDARGRVFAVAIRAPAEPIAEVGENPPPPPAAASPWSACAAAFIMSWIELTDGSAAGAASTVMQTLDVELRKRHEAGLADPEALARAVLKYEVIELKLAAGTYSTDLIDKGSRGFGEAAPALTVDKGGWYYLVVFTSDPPGAFHLDWGFFGKAAPHSADSAGYLAILGPAVLEPQTMTAWAIKPAGGPTSPFTRPKKVHTFVFRVARQ